jgi:hypothetical protein
MITVTAYRASQIYLDFTLFLARVSPNVTRDGIWY